MLDKEVVLGEIGRACASWYRANGRRYPWRESRDPYHILVAEFLLRKTQVYRVLPVYSAFISKYPSLYELARAEPSDVQNLTAPLGLPQRGSQMVEMARALAAGDGNIDSGECLLKFKGIGRYIANAIECLSFGKPAPLIDGAVGRLLIRVFGLTKTKPAYADEKLWNLAQKILYASSENYKEVSLGMIDVSAVFCKVNSPLCNGCPLYTLCTCSKSDVGDTQS